MAALKEKSVTIKKAPFYLSKAFKVETNGFGQAEEVLIGYQILCELDSTFSMCFDPESEAIINGLVDAMNSSFAKGVEYCQRFILVGLN